MIVVYENNHAVDGNMQSDICLTVADQIFNQGC